MHAKTQLMNTITYVYRLLVRTIPTITKKISPLFLFDFIIIMKEVMQQDSKQAKDLMSLYLACAIGA